MKNKIIDVFKIKDLNLVSITVEKPDFSNSKPNSLITIGGKNYIFNNIVMGRSKQLKNTFTINYTEDDLIGEQVVFG